MGSYLDDGMELEPAVGAPRCRPSARVKRWALVLAACAASAVAGAQWGTTTEARRWRGEARRLHELEVHHLNHHHHEVRGELWMRCATTVYNLSGCAVEFR